MRTRLGILIATVIVVVVFLGLEFLLEPDPSRRSFRFMPDMVDAPTGRSQSESQWLPGGRVQQPIVAGVVVHGSEDFPYQATPEDAARAGKELKSPFLKVDEKILERGASRYQIFCSHCHGENGVDPGLVVQHGMTSPPSLLAQRAKTLPDGSLYHIITLGQGNMPAHGPQVLPEDRWKIVAHIRSLQSGGQ